MADDPKATETDAESQLTRPVTPPGGVPVQDLDEIMDPSMPEVQEHTIQAAREARAAQSSGEPIKGKTDAKGRTFDTVLHEIGPDGGPIINARGYIKERRGGAAQKASRGEKPQASFSRPKNAPEGQPSPEAMRRTAQAEALEARIQSTAQVSAMVIITSARIVGGEEFEPEDGEAQAMSQCFADYYRIRGIVDLPPEVMLAVGIGGYVAKRWNKPKFAETRKGWWLTIKGWFRNKGEAREGRDSDGGADGADVAHGADARAKR